MIKIFSKKNPLEHQKKYLEKYFPVGSKIQYNFNGTEGVTDVFCDGGEKRVYVKPYTMELSNFLDGCYRAKKVEP